MSGLQVGSADAPVDESRTVAPAILQQHTPAVRYIDPAQSNVVMESGTKSPSVSLASFHFSPPACYRVFKLSILVLIRSTFLPGSAGCSVSDA